VLASADVVWASWSADASWLAVWDGVTNGTPDERHLRLLDGTGQVVRALDGTRLVWLDSSRFVLFGGSAGGEAFLGSATSTELTPLEVDFSDALSNHHGTVAFIAFADAGARTARTSFVLWSPSGTTQVLSGEPEAWTADGTRLAVWHYTTPGQSVGGQPSGWFEVLSWPDLHVLVSIKNVPSYWGPFSFDPSGRFLKVPVVSGSSVLDISTGTMVGPSASQVVADPVWDRAGHLIVPSLDGSGSVTFYSMIDGDAVRKTGLGDSAAASLDGSTVLLYFAAPGEGPVTLLRDGAPRTIPVPGPVEPTRDALSDDGSGLVLVCRVGGQDEALLFAAS
jgi:hypothetical protein